MSCLHRFVAAAALAALVSAPAFGGTVSLVGNTSNSNHNIGAFETTLTYNAFVQQLTVVLKNTTDAMPHQGYITGFGFNIVSSDAIMGGVGGNIALASNPANFGTLVTPGHGDGWGTFEVAVTTQGGFEGGGAASMGIAAGQSGAFVFNITTSDAGSLTIDDFVTQNSTGAGKNTFFLVRMRGFPEPPTDGSDWVPATLLVPIPAPPALGLGLAGMLGGALLRRRRRGA